MADCELTGTIKDLHGDAIGGKRLTFTPVSVTGELIHTASRPVTSSTTALTLGQFTVTLIQGGSYNIQGNVLGFTGTGLSVTIPSSGSATLESLLAAASIPTQGLTIKDEGTALASLIGTLNFVGSGVSVAQASAGVATVTIAGGGGGASALDDLTDVTITSFANDDILQRKAGVVVNRTMAQLKTDLVLAKADVGLGSVDNVQQLPLSYLDTDIALTANSDVKVPSQKAAKAYMDAAVAALVAAAPGTLDTLNEIATALGGDANLSATLTTSIGTKLAKSSNLSDLTNAGTARTNLGLAIGSDVQAFNSNLSTFAGITPSANVQNLLGAADFAAFKSSLNLNLVENTALSSWAGSTNLTTLGTIGTGSWDATAIPFAKLAFTGTPDGTKFLRDDGSWQAAAGGGVALGDSPTWTGVHNFAPTARASGVAPYLRITTPADTGQTLNTEFPGIIFGGNASGATVTRTGADGTTIAFQREYIFTAPTYAFAGATTITNAATLAINAAPIAGANATLTSKFALWVQSGMAKFDAEVGIATGVFLGSGSIFGEPTASSYGSISFYNTGDGLTKINNPLFGVLITTPKVTMQDAATGTPPSTYLYVGKSASLTSSVFNLLTLDHTEMSAGAVGLGTGISFLGRSTTANSRQMAQVAAVWTTATDASRSADLVFNAVNNAVALAQVMRIKSDSRLILGVPNSAPTDADIDNNFATAYIDQTANKLHFRLRYSDGSYKTAELALT